MLVAIAVVLAAPLLHEHYFGDQSIDLPVKTLGAVLAVAASIVTYRRFFHGRIFAPRLRLRLSSTALCALSDGNILHSIDVEAENIGSVTIWSPTLDLDVLELDSDTPCTVNGTATEGIKQSLRPGGIEGIEPGELEVYHHRCRVPATLEAFRITAELSMDRRHAWHRSITVANTANKGKAGNKQHPNGAKA